MPTPKLSEAEVKRVYSLVQEAIDKGYTAPGRIAGRGQIGACGYVSKLLNRANNYAIRCVQLAEDRYGLSLKVPEEETNVIEPNMEAEKLAARRGEMGTLPVLDGFELTKTTTVYDKNGDVAREFIQQKPERGDIFEPPEGHYVKGVSALVDPSGRVLTKWVKTSEDRGLSDVVEGARHAFEEYRGAFEPQSPPIVSDSELATAYKIADVHLGLHAWGKETGDQDWDLRIGESVIIGAVDELVERSPNSRVGIVLDIGDTLHSDNRSAQTEVSGHNLDVDTRFGKVVRVATSATRRIIERALQKHEIVIYRKTPGNHDYHASQWLTAAFSMFYENEPRVIVADDPGKHWAYQHGRTMLVATHGDTLKPDHLAEYAAAAWKEMWGSTDFRYAFTGHVHHKAVLERPGIIIETMPTLTARDAYAGDGGYFSFRTMSATTYHSEFGEYERHTVTAKAKKPK